MRKEHLEVSDLYIWEPRLWSTTDFHLKLYQCPYYLIIIIYIYIYISFQNKVRNDEKKKSLIEIQNVMN